MYALFPRRPRLGGVSRRICRCSILECYYDINRADRFDVSLGYTDMFRQFLSDQEDWQALFTGYWQQYVGQISAQARAHLIPNSLPKSMHTCSFSAARQ